MVTQGKQTSMVLASGQQIAFREVQDLAQAAARSKYFDGLSPEQALVKAVTGQAYGFHPAVALSAIHIINGKPVVSSGGLAALIKASGRYRYTVNRWDHSGCVLTFYEKMDSKWEKQGESSFTIEDAQRAGLLEKKGSLWKTYPRNMCFARAISNGAHIFCPDIAGGLYTPEEMDAPVNGEGEIIEAEIVTSPAYSSTPTPAPAPAQQKTNGDWGRIMNAVHGAADEHGLNHDDLHNLLQVDSLHDADPGDLRDLPGSLRAWAAADEQAGVSEKLAHLREDLDSAEDLQTMAEKWQEWGDTMKSWSRLAKIKAAKIKEEAKAAYNNDHGGGNE